MPEREPDRDGGAERVADDDRPTKAEARCKAADEFDPALEGVRPFPFAVAKRGQVDRKDSMRFPKARADVLPDRACNDETAQNDDRGSPTSPTPIGDEPASDVDERSVVERGRGLDLPVGGRVVRQRGKRQRDEESEGEDANALRPALESLHRLIVLFRLAVASVGRVLSPRCGSSFTEISQKTLFE